MTRTGPVIAAHRGGALLWPENSMTAFRGALTLPIDQIETDVRLSSEGEPFLLHDATLDRTTEASGIASDREWAALAGIRLKRTRQDCIPHLRELLALLAPSPVNLRLELKNDASGGIQSGLAEVALARLARHGMLERTTITSFDLGYLAEAARAPLAGRIWLVRRPLVAEHGLAWVLAEAAAAGVPEIALHIDNAGLAARFAGSTTAPRLGFYAVNDKAAIATALGLGASAFTTDRPDLAVGMVAGDAATAAGKGNVASA